MPSWMIFFFFIWNIRKFSVYFDLEMVKGVIVMIIGTILLAVALPVGIVLAVDLLNEQHHSATQNNHW